MVHFFTQIWAYLFQLPPQEKAHPGSKKAKVLISQLVIFPFWYGTHNAASILTNWPYLCLSLMRGNPKQVVAINNIRKFLELSFRELGNKTTNGWNKVYTWSEPRIILIILWYLLFCLVHCTVGVLRALSSLFGPFWIYHNSNLQSPP